MREANANQSVSDVGEKTLIASLIEPQFWDADGAKGLLIGDDAAVVTLAPNRALVASIDKIPERLIGQELGLMNYEDVGTYLVAASLSDVAAMGAAGLGLLISLCLPSDFPIKDFHALIQGIKRGSVEFGVPVLGGDTKAGSTVGLVATAMGVVEPDAVLRRRDAKPGHLVCVTGNPGRFGAALAYFLTAARKGGALSSAEEEWLLRSFRFPQPRLEAGQLLAHSRRCGACQDVSDGLGQTAIEIALASGVAVVLDVDALVQAGPASLKVIAAHADTTERAILLGPGADFELMFTAAPQDVEEFQTLLGNVGLQLHQIGEVTEGSGVRVREHGNETEISNVGYEHFTKYPDAELIRDRQGL